MFWSALCCKNLKFDNILREKVWMPLTLFMVSVGIYIQILHVIESKKPLIFEYTITSCTTKKIKLPVKSWHHCQEL